MTDIERKQKTELVPVADKVREINSLIYDVVSDACVHAIEGRSTEASPNPAKALSDKVAELLTDAVAALSEERKRADAAIKVRERLQDSNSKMAEGWTALLKRADAAEAENFVLAANQCDGPMIGDEHGHFSCAKVTDLTATVERLRAALATTVDDIEQMRADLVTQRDGYDDVGNETASKLTTKAIVLLHKASEPARAALQESTDG